jgi:hypothetical protein
MVYITPLNPNRDTPYNLEHIASGTKLPNRLGEVLRLQSEDGAKWFEIASWKMQIDLREGWLVTEDVNQLAVIVNKIIKDAES